LDTLDQLYETLQVPAGLLITHVVSQDSVLFSVPARYLNKELQVVERIRWFCAD
jgi:hypothetical protein